MWQDLFVVGKNNNSGMAVLTIVPTANFDEGIIMWVQCVTIIQDFKKLQKTSMCIGTLKFLGTVQFPPHIIGIFFGYKMINYATEQEL